MVIYAWSRERTRWKSYCNMFDEILHKPSFSTIFPPIFPACFYQFSSFSTSFNHFPINITIIHKYHHSNHSNHPMKPMKHQVSAINITVFVQDTNVTCGTWRWSNGLATWLCANPRSSHDRITSLRRSARWALSFGIYIYTYIYIYVIYMLFKDFIYEQLWCIYKYKHALWYYSIYIWVWFMILLRSYQYSHLEV
jgi:hypothetical protein